MEIISVGNELLIGKTHNTNATWLAKRVTSLGLTVKRITVIGDDVDQIAEALQEALHRKPSFIITTGGLGPTFDDKTLAGIAKGLNRRLEVNGKALKMVRKKYEAYLKVERIKRVELTQPRVKMATLPEGTKPIPNPVGTAPGVMAKVKGTCIIALPGVPPEMKAIFNESLAEVVKKEAGKSSFFEKSIYADGIMESNLAPLIDKVMLNNPYVYVKSHVYTESPVKVEGQRSHIELHLSTTADDPETARSRLDAAVSHLSELVRRNGGRIRE